MTLRSRSLAHLCALVLLLGCGATAHAKRVALVIGNDNYQQVTRLEEAGNDADAMARELQAAGFEVRKHRDLNFKQIVVALEAFFDQIKGGDEVAVFYAGHGVQTERGSYLLPTDVEGETQSQIEKVSYSVNGLLEELDKVKPRFSLVIVDTCRDNPLRSRGRTVGIARGLNVEALAQDVTNSVERLARTVNHDQRPLIVNDSSGEFYFFAPGAGREDQFWQDTKAPDNIEGYEAYLSIYPNGRYAGLARANISRLRARPGTTPAPAPGLGSVLVTSAPASQTTRPAPATNTPGFASYTLTNGDRYEGDTVGAVCTGKGQYQFANGDRYEGSFASNVKEGVGVHHGKGVHTFANGQIKQQEYVHEVEKTN